MKLTMRPRCFGGGHPRVVACEQMDRQDVAELARFRVRLAEMARQMEDDLARAYEELEQLFPEFSLHRSWWQRIKDAFRRLRAERAPTNPDDDGAARVARMSPFLKNFLSPDYYLFRSAVSTSSCD
jgi:uncharacterized membrane protein YccC